MELRLNNPPKTAFFQVYRNRFRRFMPVASIFIGVQILFELLFLVLSYEFYKPFYFFTQTTLYSMLPPIRWFLIISESVVIAVIAALVGSPHEHKVDGTLSYATRYSFLAKALLMLTVCLFATLVCIAIPRLWELCHFAGLPAERVIFSRIPFAILLEEYAMALIFALCFAAMTMFVTENYKNGAAGMIAAGTLDVIIIGGLIGIFSYMNEKGVLPSNLTVNSRWVGIAVAVAFAAVSALAVWTHINVKRRDLIR